MDQDGQPVALEMNHQNELAIVDASENWLRDNFAHYCGISVDLYQFPYDQTEYQNTLENDTVYQNRGHIFHANKILDLTFEGHIDALDDSNKREAMFIVHEANKQQYVEDMMTRSFRMKHVGIGRTYLIGYNTQISKVVSGHGAPTCTFSEWLQARRPTSNATLVTIPTEVQELLRIGFQAIEKIWEEGCTSDDLAKADSYHMTDNWVKINPLRIRDRNPGEDDNMPIRHAFSDMILNHIYTIWEDNELLDLIDLLNNKEARDAHIILGAPVLLLPGKRELMYYTYDNTTFVDEQFNWLKDKAYPGDGWKNTASNVDPALKKIIDYQVEKDGVGFTLDFKGALHFASVVTGHYRKHFKDLGLDPQNVDMKAQVDFLLKRVLPRMLSKIYNSEYEYEC